MKNKVKFIKELNSYRSHLEKRLDAGAKYIDENNCMNDKYYNTYAEIIKELSHIQTLVNYYDKKTL